MKKVNTKLRVMHFPQVPCKPFIVDVDDEWQAAKIEDTLAKQHLFLLDQNIIPDYSNAISVVMWDDSLEPDENDEKWTDYWNEGEMMEWDEFRNKYLTGKSPKDNQITDRFFLEEIVHRLKNKDMEYVKQLAEDWLCEMIRENPLTERQRKQHVREIRGDQRDPVTRDFTKACYFGSEKELKNHLGIKK